MTRFRILLAALFLFTARLCAADDLEAAYQDWHEHGEQSRYFYITTAMMSNAFDGQFDRQQLETALNLVIPSMRNVKDGSDVVEDLLPVKIGPTLLRMDINALGWPEQAFFDLLRPQYDENGFIVKGYPYRAVADNHVSFFLRGDWLLTNLTDQPEAKAYTKLVFGDPPPKTIKEIEERVGASNDVRFKFGIPAGKSPVSVQGHRLAESRAILRGYYWLTSDYLEINNQTAPIEHLAKPAIADGHEGIIGLPVHSTKGTRGALQVYFLANKQEAIIDRAAAELVHDYNQTRGKTSIATCNSCLNCHTGLNAFAENELRTYLASGVENYADEKTQRLVESLYLSDLIKELDRNNEDYADIVKVMCGVSAADAHAAYGGALQRYDQDVSLERLAIELGRDPREVLRALAHASAVGGSLGNQLSGLAHGIKAKRRVIEQDFLALDELCRDWERGR